MPAAGPGRLLLVTGSIGEGHHAAARAVEERARALWDGVEVVWTDTLADMGRGTAPAFRSIYAGCVRYLPWLYGLYHRLLRRVPPFRAATRAVIGAWSAPGLAAAVDRHRPDLVVATFPEGVTGLDRLRRRGRLPVAAAAVVADPAPHPLWIGPSLDLHLVSTAAGAEMLRRWAPEARVRVGAPPVARRFHPPDGDRAAGPPRVLVSCGSMAFGDVAGICRAVLDTGADVLVGTGRDPALRRRLERMAAGPALDVRDWIDDPAAAVRGCDVVVTNAGGATALEAIACTRPLLLVDPVPGHGEANALLLARAGLARLCRGPDELGAAVRELSRPDRHAAAVAALRAHLRSTDPDADVAALGRLRAPDGGRMRAQDAFFLDAATRRVPQQVGAVVVLDPGGVEARRLPRLLADLVRERAPGIDLLCRSLTDGRSPRWVRDPAPDPGRHVRAAPLTVGPDGRYRSVDDAATAFFGSALDPAVAWELAVAPEPATDRVAVLARAHHALGDGLVITDALVALLTDESAERPHGRARGVERPPRPLRWRRAARTLRGLWHLAAMPPAGRSPLTGTVRGPVHRRIGVDLDGPAVRAAARAHGVGTTALVLAVLAEALHRTFAEAGVPASRVRAMVPITTRTRAGADARATGNRMAVVPADLPTGPMPPHLRVAAVARAVHRAGTGGRPEAASAAVDAAGRLPRPLRGPVVRLVHGRRFFHLVASVMPGVRRTVHVGGRRVDAIRPVLPLAGGVGLAVGALHCGSRTCVGITADPDLVPLLDGLADRVRASLRDMGRS
ncbi:MGDG synthase family glycosyltransferase [Pseudonocardia endophytica]|uniref:MGDG synthase family glycosyltransferase n=1 Tax=Pseudonocardia endophytica TaxID=401976 RepID=UPI001404ACE5|nr:WS/DGAT domain-containing protein [Pseudonocardia endophytica]